MNTLIKNPPLKYNGAKWLLAPFIISHIPKHQTFVDVFGGGASVMLRKDPSKYEFYNDKDLLVYNFFKVLRSRGKELIEALENTPVHYQEYLDSFRINEIECPVEKARLFYVHCWLSRNNNLFDSKGDFRRVVSPIKLFM